MIVHPKWSVSGEKLVGEKLDVLQASACVWAAAEQQLARMHAARERTDDLLANRSEGQATLPCPLVDLVKP